MIVVGRRCRTLVTKRRKVGALCFLGLEKTPLLAREDIIERRTRTVSFGLFLTGPVTKAVK